MQAGLTGVEIDTSVFRPANYIESAIGNLSNSLSIGLVLALVILVLFLWNWRTALISLVTIPLSLFTAAMVLYWQGATLNAMTLAGLVIALGVIIDDVVIDVNNIAHRLRQAREKGDDISVTSVIHAASLEVRGSIAYATLILLLVVLPVFFMPGLTGLFFHPLVNAYVIAILTSLAVAVLITPGFTLLLMANGGEGSGKSPLMNAFEAIYSGLAGMAVRGGSYAMFGLAIILTIVGLVLFPMLTPSLVPEFQQTDLVIAWNAAPGTSHTAMSRTVAQASEELKALDGVAKVSAHVGRAETGDQIVGINSAQLWVSLNPAANYDQTVAAMREITDGYPGVFRNVETYMPTRTEEALLGPDSDIVVRVYGIDLTTLHDKAVEIAELISVVEGVADAQTHEQIVEPQIDIAIDLAAAEQYGILPGDVRRQATTLLSGLQVGSLFEEQKVFEVVVWSKPELRNDLTDIQQMLIDLPDGNQIPLSEVAAITIVPIPITIHRDAVSRYADVAVMLDGRSAAAVTADIRSSLKSVAFPLEFRAEILGESLVDQASQQRTNMLIIAALIGIYLLIQAAFGGWRLAFGVLLAMLMALSGGVLGAFLLGGTLSLGVIFGLLAIFGLAIRNGLVMINHIQQLERDEDASSPALIQQAAQEQAGIIFTTTLVTAVTLLPLVLLGNMPGHEILRPMAIVTLCGMVTSTLANLLAIPAIYARLRPEPNPDNMLLVNAPTMGGAD